MHDLAGLTRRAWRAAGYGGPVQGERSGPDRGRCCCRRRTPGPGRLVPRRNVMRQPGRRDRRRWTFGRDMTVAAGMVRGAMTAATAALSGCGAAWAAVGLSGARRAAVGVGFRRDGRFVVRRGIRPGVAERVGQPGPEGGEQGLGRPSCPGPGGRASAMCRASADSRRRRTSGSQSSTGVLRIAHASGLSPGCVSGVNGAASWSGSGGRPGNAGRRRLRPNQRRAIQPGRDGGAAAWRTAGAGRGVAWLGRMTLRPGTRRRDWPGAAGRRRRPARVMPVMTVRKVRPNRRTSARATGLGRVRRKAGKAGRAGHRGCDYLHNLLVVKV